MKTPIYTGLAQSDLDFANFKASNANLSDYAGSNMTWNTVTKKFDATGGGGGSSLGLVINVKSSPYNATGNGTTDDTAALQAAINAVAAGGGGTVYFPRGIYLCNGAFDSTNNGILNVPFQSIGATPLTITLLGEIAASWVGPSPVCAMIKTTKTGTGTGPALLAAGPYFGATPQNENGFNNVMVRLQNIYFFSPTDTLNIVRLDSAGMAIIDDCIIIGGGSTTSGIVGLTMPNTGNFAHLWANRVLVSGCAVALQTGEHFRSPMFTIGSAATGVRFMYADEPSWANFCFIHCIHFLEFTGNHSVDLFLDIERASDTDTYATSVDIYDPNNYGSGVGRYKIVKGGGVGPITTPITVTGGGNLSFTNLYTGLNTVAPIGGSVQASQFYIGTDLRLVSITGGGKLQARNPGTNTWADVDKWTNP